MAQSGYTPIQLYRTTTAAAVPLTANLAPGELAINIANGDMALFMAVVQAPRLLQRLPARRGMR